jgi:hypothetical protein
VVAERANNGVGRFVQSGEKRDIVHIGSEPQDRTKSSDPQSRDASA